jgi:hypothetical protein
MRPQRQYLEEPAPFNLVDALHSIRVKPIVSQAAPATPPAHGWRGLATMKPGTKLMKAVERVVIRGVVVSCIPRHAACVDPIMTAAIVPRSQIRPFLSRAENWDSFTPP